VVVLQRKRLTGKLNCLREEHKPARCRYSVDSMTLKLEGDQDILKMERSQVAWSNRSTVQN